MKTELANYLNAQTDKLKAEQKIEQGNLVSTRVTCSWAYTVEVKVDPSKMGDEAYLDEVRSKAVEAAGENLCWKDGMVTDCEDFPQLGE